MKLVFEIVLTFIAIGAVMYVVRVLV